MQRFLSSVLLGALFLPRLAHANVITFNYTGAVTQVPIDDFATGIQPGDAITGNFTFDSLALDAIPAVSASPRWKQGHRSQRTVRSSQNGQPPPRAALRPPAHSVVGR